MSKITRECTDLLSKNSELERKSRELLSKNFKLEGKSREILSKLSELISDQLRNNSSHTDGLTDKTDDILEKIDRTNEMLEIFSETLEPNLSQPPTIGKLISENHEGLFELEKKLRKALKLTENIFHLKLSEEADKMKKQAILHNELKNIREKIRLDTQEEKKDKNLGTKTALYLSSILALSLAYLTSKK